MSLIDDIHSLQDSVHYEEDLISTYECRIVNAEDKERAELESKISMMRSNIATYKRNIADLENKYYQQTYGRG